MIEVFSTVVIDDTGHPVMLSGEGCIEQVFKGRGLPPLFFIGDCKTDELLSEWDSSK